MAGFITDLVVKSSHCVPSAVTKWQEMLMAEFTVTTGDLSEGTEKTH